MIAADTSILVDYIENKDSAAIRLLVHQMDVGQLYIPPPVLAELLSNPSPRPLLFEALAELPLLGLKPDFWKRAGNLRAVILRKGFKSRLADALIAQSCIDHDVPLLTNDVDFRHYAEFGGLKLAA